MEYCSRLDAKPNYLVFLQLTNSWQIETNFLQLFVIIPTNLGNANIWKSDWILIFILMKSLKFEAAS